MVCTWITKFPGEYSGEMAVIRLQTNRLCSPRIAPGCNGDKNTSVRTSFADYRAILVSTIAYMYILVKNSHQI